MAIAPHGPRRTGVDWQDCPEDWNLARPIQCGRVSVPMDYAKPYGSRSSSPSTVSATTGAKSERQGALLYNPGGPGGSGLRFPPGPGHRQEPVWADAARAYDFVGSTRAASAGPRPSPAPIRRSSSKAPKADPCPLRGRQARPAGARREYAEGCHERSGEMLPHMTTPNTARDLDVIRAGPRREEAQLPRRLLRHLPRRRLRHPLPGHVRRMVVDSVVNPSREKIWYRANLDQDVAFEGR
ncbi:hypothetical protein GCM10023238_23700 [Streptomyces heliomycini]